MNSEIAQRSKKAWEAPALSEMFIEETERKSIGPGETAEAGS
jgi:hypothetical protein